MVEYKEGDKVEARPGKSWRKGEVIEVEEFGSPPNMNLTHLIFCTRSNSKTGSCAFSKMATGCARKGQPHETLFACRRFDDGGFPRLRDREHQGMRGD
jgi:hypothetical protein